LREKRGVEQAQEQDDARADDDGLAPALPPVLAAAHDAPAHVQVVHVGHGDGHAYVLCLAATCFYACVTPDNGFNARGNDLFFSLLLGPDLAQEGVQDTPDVIREQLLVVDPGSDLHIGRAQHDNPMQRQSMRSVLTSEQGGKIDESQIGTLQLDALAVISVL